MGSLRTRILSAREAVETYGSQIRSFDFQPMARSEDPHKPANRFSNTLLLPVAEQSHPVVYQVEKSSR